MLPSRLLGKKAARTHVQVAKYTNPKPKISLKEALESEPELADISLGKFQGVVRSGVLERQTALVKEYVKLAKEDLKAPILDANAAAAYDDVKSVMSKEAFDGLITALQGDLTSSDILKTKDFLLPRNPNYDKKAIDIFVKHYETLYASWTKVASEEPFTPVFYELEPELQEAWRAYRAADKELTKQLKEKYGDKFTPVLNRLQVARDILQGSTFPVNVPTEPIRVAITGACGQIGYALAFRIASGGLFGPNVPVVLHLLEIPQAMETLQGLIMELQDCAFPTLKGIIATESPERAFEGVDYALLVGASPRGKGQERKDLLLKNAEIFSIQGKALNIAGKREHTRVVVVGNPANTNALIAQQNAPNIPAQNFSAMTRLDHNRGLSQLSSKLGVHVDDISNFVIWGNHSATQFPDVSYATVPVSLSTGLPIPGNRPGLRPDNMGYRLVTDLIDEEYILKQFIPQVQQRGAAIIEARGFSSAQSAAGSLIDSVHDWHYGTNASWTSAAVYSSGEYGVEKGLFFSYPVVYSDKQWDIVRHLPIDEFQAGLLEKTQKELKEERDAVSKFLPGTSAKGGDFMSQFDFDADDEPVAENLVQ